VGVRDDLTRIVASGQGFPEEFVHPELLGPGDLDPAVHRRPDCDSGYRLGDVVARDRLEQHRGHPDRAVDGGGVGDAFHELEELCRVHDRIRDRGVLDQLFLGDLRLEVAALG
jgi:hypothetical protein